MNKEGNKKNINKIFKKMHKLLLIKINNICVVVCIHKYCKAAFMTAQGQGPEGGPCPPLHGKGLV